MDEIEEDEEDIFDKGDKKYRIIKYHKHGILKRIGENWGLETKLAQSLVLISCISDGVSLRTLISG